MKTKMSDYWSLLAVGGAALLWAVVRNFQGEGGKFETSMTDRSRKADAEINSLNRMIAACERRIKYSNVKKQIACTKLTWEMINKIKCLQSEMLEHSEEVFRKVGLAMDQLLNEINVALTNYEVERTSKITNDISVLKGRYVDVINDSYELLEEQKRLLKIIEKLQPNVHETRGKENIDGEDKLKKATLKKFESSLYQHQVYFGEALEIIHHGLENYQELVSDLKAEQSYWSNSQDFAALLERTYWLRKVLERMFTNLEFVGEHTANMKMISKFIEIKHLLDGSEAIRITNILCGNDTSLSILRKKYATCYFVLCHLLESMELILEPAWNLAGGAPVAGNNTEGNGHNNANTSKTEETSGSSKRPNIPVKPEKVKKPSQKKKFQNKSKNSAAYDPESRAWPDAKVEARQNNQGEKATEGRKIEKEGLLNLASRNDIDELLQIAKLAASEKEEKKVAEAATRSGRNTGSGAGDGAKKPPVKRRPRCSRQKEACRERK